MIEELLNYRTYGENRSETLMIVHGLFGSLDNWMSLAKLWSTDFFVIIVDVRNHGKSFHTQEMSFESMSKDLWNVMQRENIQKMHLMGHSMGGKIAMDFASLYPECIEKMIVVDVAPYKYSPHHNEVFHMLHQVDLAQCQNRGDAEEQIRQYLHDDAVVLFMGKNVRRNEITHQFEWKFNQDVLEKNYPYLIQRIPNNGFKGKVLFIGGDRSPYITKETSLLIFELYPNVEIEYVSNAGHWVHADNPQEFYEKIKNFIQKNKSNSRNDN